MVVNLVVVVGLAFLLLMATSLWLDIYTRHNERIDVPSLRGVPLSEAKRCLELRGLRPMVLDSVYSAERPGAVVEQVPAAGLPVKKGRIIYLTINAECPRMVKMMEVREGGSRQAISTLRSLGFVIDSVKAVASDMDDLVLGVTANGRDMIPGQEYVEGTHVVVRVGSTKLMIEAENGEEEAAWME